MKGAALAIDHGTQRTGFASTDPLRIATRPLDVWHGGGDDPALIAHALELANDHGADTLIVGMPYNMDGSVGARGRDVLAFMGALRAAAPAQRIVPQDERLSTKEAEELLRQAGHHGPARKARRDSWSALVLLRDWIEQGEPEREWPAAD